MIQTVQICRQIVAIQLQHDGVSFANHMYVFAIDDVVGRLKTMIQLQQHEIGYWIIECEFVNSHTGTSLQPLIPYLAQSQTVDVERIVPDLFEVIVIGVRYL